MYSNCCCSCSFEPEIIKIGQSSHKIYSNKILNFQESTTILNACTKKPGNLLNAPHMSVAGYPRCKRVNPNRKSGVEPRRQLAGVFVTFRQLLHPLWSSAILTLSRTESGPPGQESEAGSVPTYFTLNKDKRNLSINSYLILLPQVLWQ